MTATIATATGRELAPAAGPRDRAAEPGARRRHRTASADQLTDALDDGRDDERRRAVRGLLRHPLLAADRPDPALFQLVRRHALWLQEWFARETGWPLRVDSGVARLTKIVADVADPSRPAVASVGQRAPFSRRRYVLTCLALAVLERSDSQVTLGRLVERIVVLAADPALEAAGITFRMEGRDERTDLAAVARLLLGHGVLTRVAGDEQAFVNATGDVLYDVDRRLLSTLLGARRGPSLLASSAWSADPRAAAAQRVAALVAEPRPDTDELRNRAIRHRLARRLLDDPVVYDADLTDEERTYLRTQRTFLLRRLTEGSGLVAEVRAEGIALVDPTGESSDVGMPEEGTDGHVTLLVAEFLARRIDTTARTPLAHVERHVRSLAAGHRGHWRRDATVPGAERELVRTALARLEGLTLVRRHRGAGPDEASVEPLAALARFTFGVLRIAGDGATTDEATTDVATTDVATTDASESPA
jgi:uncharacterized protein (TIGR02678 family)